MRKVIFITWILTAASIAFFLSLQFIFNMQPCKLCLLQRIPYYAAFVSIVVYFFTNPRYMHLIFIASFICALIVSGFHFFVEEGVLNYSCTFVPVESIEELKTNLLIIPADCSKKAYFVGIRLTIASFLLNIFLVTINIFSLFIKKK